MRPVEIEAWALRIVEVVAAGNTVEDSAVELKADWPDPIESARRIAGLANAARGARTLWIIGLDEKRGIVPRSATDPATWWSQVAAQFDEIAPAMTDVLVHVPTGGTVFALCFETGRAPYVVKNPAGGKIQREVPWREGTALRTAKRSDLIRVLVPAQATPRLDIVSARLYVTPHRDNAGRSVADSPDLDWRLDATVYFTAGQGSYVVFPARLQRVVLEPEVVGVRWPASRVEFNAKQSYSTFGPPPPGVERGADMRVQTVHNGVEQLIVESHGYAWAVARGVIPAVNGVRPIVHIAENVRVTLSLSGVELPSLVVATAEMAQADAAQAGWTPPPIGYWRTVDEEPD